MTNLTIIENKRILANYLKIPYKSFIYILYHLKNPYYSFEIPKKDGTTRNIHAPHPKLKSLQKNIKILLEKQYNLMCTDKNSHKAVHGFIKERSIFTNANIHKNKSVVFNIDIEKFFESIHFGRVRGFLIKNKYFMLNEDVATTLAKLICHDGHLPQGAPTSPVMSNLILNIFDVKVLEICKRYSVDYTRYADDLTFSSNSKDFFENFGDFYKEIETLINRNGFKLNGAKYRIQLKNSRQEVTGLIVNNKINIKKEYYKNTRAMVNNIINNNIATLNDNILSLNQLEGRLSFIHSIELYKRNIEYTKKIQLKEYDKDFLTYLKTIKYNSKERNYQKFLFYKLFFNPSQVVVITEGITDSYYLKAALKKYYLEYPSLIEYRDNEFIYKLKFLNRNNRLEYFFGITKDGGDSLSNLLNFYSSRKNSTYFQNHYNYYDDFIKKLHLKHSGAIVLLFDNEGTSKPLHKFINKIQSQITKKPDELKKILNQTNPSPVNIIGNIYLLSINKEKEGQDFEIEDLIKDYTSTTIIDGKMFKNKGNEDSLNKIYLAKHVLNNYKNIDLSQIKPILDNIVMLNDNN